MYNIDISRVTLRTIPGMQMQKFRRIMKNCTRALAQVYSSLSEFSGITTVIVCTRVLKMCVRRRCVRINVVLARGTTERLMKRDSLRRLEAERSRSRSLRSVSNMRFFARARSRGLSRSQPVFVIIMLEKCMNICFINASSYFICFYMIKGKVRQNFPIRALIPLSCNIYIYIYILYIYLCIIRYCAHYCSQS